MSKVFKAAHDLMAEQVDFEGYVPGCCYYIFNYKVKNLDFVELTEFFHDLFSPTIKEHAQYAPYTGSSFYWGFPCKKTMGERLLALLFAAEIAKDDEREM